MSYKERRAFYEDKKKDIIEEEKIKKDLLFQKTKERLEDVFKETEERRHERIEKLEQKNDDFYKKDCFWSSVKSLMENSQRKDNEETKRIKEAVDEILRLKG